MTSERLLKHLRDLGVRLWAEEGKLRFQAAKGVLTPELRAELGRRKEEVLSFLEGARQAVSAVDAPPLVAVERTPDEPLPASFAQERLWFLDQLAPGPAYNLPAAFRVSGRLDGAALHRSLTEIVHRHEVLRTCFAAREGHPVQVVEERRDVPFPVVDLADLPPGRREDGLLDVTRTVARRLFDLTKGPLLRAALVRLAAAEHVVALTLHHVVFDGWSVGVLRRELMDLYGAFSRGSVARLPELPVQYADFAVWQRRWLRGERMTQELGWWRRELQGAPARLELPTDRPRPAFPSSSGRLRRVAFPAGLTGALDQEARRQEGTLFMALLAAFLVLLHRHSGQTDLVVGTPIAGRERPEVAGLIGFFVNTLALRVDVSGDPTFAEVLAQVRRTTLAAYSHQSLPFEKLVEELHPERSLSFNPVFQVAFALNVRVPEVTMSGLSLEALGVHTDTSIVDLTLSLEEDPAGGVRGFWEYSTELFDAATVARLDGHYRQVLTSAVARPETALSTFGLLRPGERFQLLREWNAAPGCAEPEGVHRLFTAQASRTPAAMALADGELRMSYQELGERSNQLAHRLRRLGVRPEIRVALFLERSAELVVAALGVWKAGGAYVPLDPSLPEARLAFLVADSGARVVLTRDHLLKRLPETAGERLSLELGAWVFGEESREAPDEEASDAHLAYVVYTSGSTGEPKGVEVEHAALANLVAWHLSTYGTGPGERTTLVAGPGFDASVWETWPALTSGASLHVADAATVASVPDLVAWLVAEEISQCFLPTPLAEEVLRSPWPAEAALRVVATGGDRLRRGGRDDVPWLLVNHYGPTENAVVTTWTPVEPGASAPPIGRPLPGVSVYLLDRRLRPVPIGAPGELAAGGASLARGYLGRPGLTAERFVPDPFAEAPGGRLYRTGDLARRLPDGQIDFLGRIDFQVKVRGFRIELGEVEAALLRHEAVAEAVVLALSGAGDEMRLVAYVVAAGDVVPDLRGDLEERLPHYMVPSAFVPLATLPLTPNGKVDRKALPAPEPRAEATAYIEPRTPAEQILAGIWAEMLGVERVGAEDDFFALGGHSLLATRVVSRVKQVFGAGPQLHELFERPRLADMARSVEEAHGRKDDELPPIERAPRDRPLPLSFSQLRLWFLEQFEPGTAAFHIPTALRLAGRLDTAALRRSLWEVCRRHESLRTGFMTVGGDPVQIVAAEPRIDLSVVDLGRSEEKARLVERLAIEISERPFDLGRGPLLRAVLLRLGPEEHVLLFIQHHIASDGWSVGVLIREIAVLYEAFAAGRPSPLPELKLQYGDFAAWQRRHLRGAALQSLLGYWREQLAGAPAQLTLPTDRPRPPVRSERGAKLHLCWGGLGALRKLCAEHTSTPFIVLMSVAKALIWRTTGQADIPMGTFIANRNRAEIEELIGFFVNTLVLRTQLVGDPSFLEVAERLRQVALGAYAHQDLPFEKLLEEPWVEREMSVSPLFQVALVFQSFQWPALELSRLQVEPLEVPWRSWANFDWTLWLWEEGSDLVGFVDYKTDLFDETTIRRFLGHYESMLRGFLAAPETRLSELSFLSLAERHQLLQAWNDTTVEREEERWVHQRIEGWAERDPERPAVIFEDRVLSYGELDRLAGRLAGRLVQQGVGPEIVVAILAERSVEMIVAAFAVLKSGGAYLPLDTTHARDRLAHLLEVAGVPVLLTTGDLATELPDLECEVMAIDAEAGSEPPLPSVRVRSENLAYVVYTSGSTGKPKGVMVTHGALLNAYLAWEESYGLSPEGCHLQMASFSFDVFAGDFVRALCSGGRLVVCPRETLLEAPALHGLMRRHGVDGAEFVPAVARHLMQYLAESGERLDFMRHLVVGSDVWYVREYRKLRSFAGEDTRTINSYGLSEVTIDSTFFEGEARGLHDDAQVPIGRPFGGTRVYVLDRGLRCVPAGVAGELCLGGLGLARGYYGQPGMTAEKYAPDPLTGVAGARLYRTGDQARYRPDGHVDFLGRVDSQVKIRGFRIEPAEVEAVLGEHPSVDEAVVVARRDTLGGARLVAYVVPQDDASADVAELRRFLKEKVPDYMVPSAFVALDALPLTSNGKVERRRLPAPAADDVGRRPASTATEKALVEIFREVTGVEQVGVETDFFAIGGHSLLATQVVSRVRERLQTELALRVLFELPVLGELAAAIDAAEGAEHAGLHVPRRPPGEPAELSFAQQRLWVLDQLEPGSAAYNLPGGLLLAGALDPSALAAALGEVVRRHEALRTTFAAEGDQPVQVVGPADFSLPLVDLRALPEARRESELRRRIGEEANRPFDLLRGPVFRTLLLGLEPERHALVLNMHHICSDAWSMGVFIQELGTLYAAGLRGSVRGVLPELPIQYADFAVWQRQWLAGEVLERQLAYWRRQLGGVSPLDLPGDRPRPPIWSGRGRSVPVAIPADLRRDLEAVGRARGATLYMTLLSGFQALLARETGRRDVVVGSPIAGRRLSQVENLIGFFVNTLALRGDLSPARLSWEDFLNRTRTVTLAAFEHQDLPFEKLVEALQPRRDRSRTPLVQAVLVLQNAPRTTLLEVPGLTFKALEAETATAKFDLTLTLWEGPSLHGSLEYATDLFDATTVVRWVRRFEALLRDAAGNPEKPLAELSLLPRAERWQLLGEWSGKSSGDAGATIDGLFTQRALEAPKAVALAWHEADGAVEEMSYGELDRRSNQLARHLRRSLASEGLVGLFLDRSPEMVVATLGVLKAGGAYAPLDPAFPQARLALLLEDTRTSLVLTQRHLADRLPAETPRLVLDEEWDVVAKETTASPEAVSTPRHLAYVMYTSGTTGRPKGVAVPHRAVVRLVRETNFASFGADEVFLQLAPVSFDASTLEIWGPLLNGGRLVLHPPGPLSLERLARSIEEHGVTTLWLTAGLFHQMVEAHPESLGRVRQLLAGGDVLSPSHVRALLERTEGRLINGYGPTENTTFTCCHGMRGGEDVAGATVPIGRPIENTTVYLLDPSLSPVGVGTFGVLYTGGDGLARGYLGRPAATAESFVPDPLGAVPGGRLYRTGDLARFLPDGRVEFQGRADQQVKLRGYRIELGEIEAVLASHEGVAEAVVVAREDGGDKRLVAYVVPAAGGDVEPLRGFLQERLPGYMVPAAFVALGALPLTANGKVDRKALPAPEARGDDESYVAPETPVQEALVGIWSEILGVKRLGVEDDFFELGGHSLLATRLVSRVNKAFRIQLGVSSLFDATTVAKMARVLVENEPRPGQTEKVARLLLKVRGMSPEELQQALARKREEVTVHE